MTPSDNSPFKATARDISSRVLTPACLFLLFLTIDFPYQYGFRYLSFLDGIETALLNATLYTALLFIATRLDLARITLCFLALPYLIFIPGWLNLPTAVILLIIFLYSMVRTLQTTTATSHESITVRDFFAFCLILMWVNLSGIGGYGYQTPDYAVHSARLKDLVDYPWPVHYGEDKNFVFYIGYFLPSAVIGKLSNADIAYRSLYPWTVLGVTLALRWLSVLSLWRFSAALVFLFIFFGPIDILNVLTLDYRSSVPFDSGIAEMLVNSDYLDFRTQHNLGFFLGNYASNTFQLYWSPHQVIAGWLVIGLMTHLFLKKQTTQFIFVYALLCLWSPLIMIALSPFVLVAVSKPCFNNWRTVITAENTLGAGTLIGVFVVFYLGGSAGTNPSSWIFNLFNWHSKLWVLLLFYICAWGLYAVAIAAMTSQEKSPHKTWFLCLILVLILLPLYKFGAYGDLLCRGSAALMFLLLVYLLRSVQHYYQKKQYAGLLLIVCLLILGSGSALLQLRKVIGHYGEHSASGPLVDYRYAAENLGPDNSLFNRYFRHKLH